MRVRRVTYATHMTRYPWLRRMGPKSSHPPWHSCVSACRARPCPQCNIKSFHFSEFRGIPSSINYRHSIYQPNNNFKMPVRPNRHASSNKRVASKIAPRLYLTCLATARDVTQLADLGITHVVSAIENAPTFPSTYPLRTLHVSISDYDGEDILSHLPVTTSFIRGALAENPKNRILVRTCYDGLCLCVKDATSNSNLR